MTVLPFVESLPANCEMHVISPTIDQSSIVWGYLNSNLQPPGGEKSALLENSDIELQPYYRRLVYPALGVTLKLKAKENAKTTKLDGFTGPGLLEELHGLDEQTVDTVRKSAEKLPSPFLVSISTAGRFKRGPCWEWWKKCLEIIEGKSLDIRTLPIIYAVPEGDGWQDFDLVKAANPGLGASIKEEVLRRNGKTPWIIPNSGPDSGKKIAASGRARPLAG